MRAPQALPPSVQTVLVSATLTPDVDTITTLLLHSPATVEIGESADGDGQSALRQFWLRCSHADKFLVMYALFKLNRRRNPRDIRRVSTRRHLSSHDERARNHRHRPPAAGSPAARSSSSTRSSAAFASSSSSSNSASPLGCSTASSHSSRAGTASRREPTSRESCAKRQHPAGTTAAACCPGRRDPDARGAGVQSRPLRPAHRNRRPAADARRGRPERRAEQNAERRAERRGGAWRRRADGQEEG